MSSQPSLFQEPAASDGKTEVLLLTGNSDNVVGYMKGFSTKCFADETAACVKHWALLFTFPDEDVPLRVEGLKRAGKLQGNMTFQDPSICSGFKEERPVHKDRVLLSREKVTNVFFEMQKLKSYHPFKNNCQDYVIEFLKKLDVPVPRNISPIRKQLKWRPEEK